MISIFAFKYISITNLNSDLFIGAYGGGYIKQYAVNEVIDDILLYNRVLSPKEVKLLFNHKIRFK